MIDKGYLYSYLVNLPKNTINVAADLVRARLIENNNYTVIVMTANVTTTELTMMTLTAFNQFVVPQLY